MGRSGDNHFQRISSVKLSKLLKDTRQKAVWFGKKTFTVIITSSACFGFWKFNILKY